MAERPPRRAAGAKVEITRTEAIMGVGFVIMTLIAIALVNLGVIPNPFILGLLITMTIGLIFIGHFLMRIGVISRDATLLWYMFSFGLVMLLYSGVMAGMLPAIAIAGATVAEIAITSALFYGLVVLSIIAGILGIWHLMRKGKIRLPGQEAGG